MTTSKTETLNATVVVRSPETGADSPNGYPVGATTHPGGGETELTRPSEAIAGYGPSNGISKNNLLI